MWNSSVDQRRFSRDFVWGQETLGNMSEILNDGKRLGKSLKRSGKVGKCPGKRRNMLVNGWYGWFFSRNFMGKWSVSKGWDFPAMLPEDINIDSQYVHILFDPGPPGWMYWCYWSSPCMSMSWMSYSHIVVRKRRLNNMSRSLRIFESPKPLGFPNLKQLKDGVNL